MKKIFMLNKPKKHLGQHFLKNRKILEEMARSAEISKKDVVLEIGPGLGSLTEILAERAGKVIAVEKDRELVPILREKFKNFKNVEIIEGDILKFDIAALKLKKYKIIANIPYYITSRFLRLFLSETNPPAGGRTELMVLMIQKEVAERIVARDGKESLLSLSVKAYAKAEIIRRVSKNFFSPPPKVDSAIIKISLRRPTSKSEQILALAKLAFQQKRKMLRHSLKNKLSASDAEKFGNKRPEELALKNWLEILRQ